MCSGPHTHLACKENSPSPPTSDPLNCKQIPSRINNALSAKTSTSQASD